MKNREGISVGQGRMNHTKGLRLTLLAFVFCISFFGFYPPLLGQKLALNDLEYFETPGINVLVYSNQFNGMFFDEKTAGIEIIHHGVRTSTGGAVRLQNTPEQWDLVPKWWTAKWTR